MKKKQTKRLLWLVITQAPWILDKSFGFSYWSWQGQVILKSFGLLHDRIMKLVKEGCVVRWLPSGALTALLLARVPFHH